MEERTYAKSDIMPLEYDSVNNGELKRKAREEEVVEYLRELNNYEMRRVLCKALYVDSYCNNTALLQALEPIVTSV